MPKFTTNSRKKWLSILLVITIIFGIFFRVINIDQKPYWHDEIYTSLRISGFTSEEVVAQIYGKIIKVDDIFKYQCPSPEKNLTDTIKGLAKKEPQHPPLYYSMIAIWSNLFGCSVTINRSLSIIFSLLTLPVLYLLCQELFSNNLVGWMAIALASISPIHIRYAQEARQYSLWTFLTLLGSLALIKAIKQNNFLVWVLYAITVSLNLYCHLLSFFVLIGHGIYVTAIKTLCQSKILFKYLIASLAGFATFFPWLLILISNKTQAEQTTNWLAQNLAFLSLLKKWGINLSRIFVSGNYELNNWLIYLSIPIFLLSLYSFYFLFKKTTNLVRIFIFTLIGTTAFILVGIDMIRTGQSSAIAPYLFPSYLGIQISIAYLLATKITDYSNQVKLWSVITVIIFSTSIMSSIISSQAETWWGWSKFDVEAAKIINSYSNPLLISDAYFGAIAPISYQLKPQVSLMLIKAKEIEIPKNFKNIFFYQASDNLLLKIEQENLELEELYKFKDQLTSLEVFLYQLKK